MNLRERATGAPEIRRYCDERCHNCYCLLPREDVAEGLHLCRGCRDAKEARSLGLSYGQMMAQRRDRAILEEQRWQEKKRQHLEVLKQRRLLLTEERKAARKENADLSEINRKISQVDDDIAALQRAKMGEAAE